MRRIRRARSARCLRQRSGGRARSFHCTRAERLDDAPAARAAAPRRRALRAPPRTHRRRAAPRRCSPAGSAGAAQPLRMLPSSVSPSGVSSPCDGTLSRNPTRRSDSLCCPSSSERRRVPVFPFRPVSLLATLWGCIAPGRRDGRDFGIGHLVGTLAFRPGGMVRHLTAGTVFGAIARACARA